MLTLSTAYWCVLIAALLPYVWALIAKTSGERYSNRDPRGWVARQTDPRVHRAYSAHLNSFEAFAPFATGVILAQLADVPVSRIAMLAIVFVLSRIAHGVCYIGNQPLLRSASWGVGLVCVLALLVQAALHAA